MTENSFLPGEEFLQSERQSRRALQILMIFGFLLFLGVALLTISVDQSVVHTLAVDHAENVTKQDASTADLKTALQAVQRLFAAEFNNLKCTATSAHAFHCVSSP